MSSRRIWDWDKLDLIDVGSQHEDEVEAPLAPSLPRSHGRTPVNIPTDLHLRHKPQKAPTALKQTKGRQKQTPVKGERRKYGKRKAGEGHLNSRVVKTLRDHLDSTESTNAQSPSSQTKRPKPSAQVANASGTPDDVDAVPADSAPSPLPENVSRPGHDRSVKPLEEKASNGASVPASANDGNDDAASTLALSNDIVMTDLSPPETPKPGALTEISINLQSTPRKPSKKCNMQDEFSDSDLDETLCSIPMSDATLPSSLLDLEYLPIPKVPMPSSPKTISLASPSSPTKKCEMKVASEKHGIAFDENDYPIPFVRPPFPRELRDRSPVLGLSNTTVHRTCFRIAQALNTERMAARQNIAIVVELYARVTGSEREGVKQRFEFADLFTDKSPILIGWHTLWDGVDFWTQDSSSFLESVGQGMMCRVLGRMRREPGKNLELSIMSIWPCSWDDVGVAKRMLGAQ